MFKKFLMKQMMKSQLKGVPEAEQERILDMVERNPEFFEKLASEIQEASKSGRDQKQVAIEVMMKHKEELGRLMQGK